MDLQLHIHRQNAQRIDHNRVVANTNRYHFVTADFTDDWEGSVIDCIGYNSRGEPVTFNRDGDKWVVPPEIIQAPAFNLSFVGVKEDGERITTTIVRVPVTDSGYTSGTMPEDRYPSKYEALMAELAAIRQEAIDAVDKVQTAVAGDVINDDLISKKTTYSSDKLEKEMSGLQGVEYSTPEDISDLMF